MSLQIGLQKLQERAILPLDGKARGQLRAVSEKLGWLEWLSQTAEEAAELSQAANKLRRAYKDLTPVPTSKAKHQLAEEAADLLVCLERLREEGDLDMDDVLDIALTKAAHWHGRIFKGEA
jgi:NTP pyrophosphatase (non-canonical NTP hydrolase)